MNASHDDGYAARICSNGHVISENISLDTREDEKFCYRCGAPIITRCLHCDTPIRGYYSVPGFDYTIPSFCYNCGKAFPWTESKLRAAQELVHSLDNLNESEKEMLAKSIDDIVRDTPRVKAATARFKRLVAKAGKEAVEGFRSLLVDIVSEAVKKSIWPS